MHHPPLSLQVDGVELSVDTHIGIFEFLKAHHLVRLEMVGADLGDREISYLAESIAVNPIIHTVDIRGNDLSPEAGDMLVTGIQSNNRSLHTLNDICIEGSENVDFSGHSRYSGLQVYEVVFIATRLALSTSVVSLSLSGLSICGVQFHGSDTSMQQPLGRYGGKGLAAIAEALPQCKSLTLLDLSCNHLGAACEALAEAACRSGLESVCAGLRCTAFAVRAPLTELSLSGQGLGEGELALVAAGVRHHGTLSSIDLSRNHVCGLVNEQTDERMYSTRGLELLTACAVAVGSPVRVLDLSFNALLPAGCECVVALLAGARGLESLSVAHAALAGFAGAPPDLGPVMRLAKEGLKATACACVDLSGNLHEESKQSYPVVKELLDAVVYHPQCSVREFRFAENHVQAVLQQRAREACADRGIELRL